MLWLAFALLEECEAFALLEALVVFALLEAECEVFALTEALVVFALLDAEFEAFALVLLELQLESFDKAALFDVLCSIIKLLPFNF